jgi:hypothetical protein
MGNVITIRDIDQEVFRDFKAFAIKRKMKLGAAMTLALLKFKSDFQTKKGRLTSFKPFHGGKGTEQSSELIDEILYGE